MLVLWVNKMIDDCWGGSSVFRSWCGKYVCCRKTPINFTISVVNHEAKLRCVNHQIHYSKATFDKRLGCGSCRRDSGCDQESSINRTCHSVKDCHNVYIIANFYRYQLLLKVKTMFQKKFKRGKIDKASCLFSGSTA